MPELRCGRVILAGRPELVRRWPEAVAVAGCVDEVRSVVGADDAGVGGDSGR
jgi:hypothetical protein